MLRKNTMYLLIIVMISTFPFLVGAISSKGVEEFDVRILSINQVQNTEQSKFNLTIDSSSPNIKTWRVRFYCDKNTKINMPESMQDVCKKVVDLKYVQNNEFAFFFTNKSNGVAKFYFKLKSYDSDGKWVHSVKKSFSWK